LIAFAKVEIEPGGSCAVTFELEDRAFAYWDVERHGWRTDPGRYTLLIGSSSRDIRAEIEITLAEGEDAVVTGPSPSR
jgi:beta-glucosidase